MLRKKTITALLAIALLSVGAFVAFWLFFSSPAGDTTRYSAATTTPPFGLYGAGTFEALPPGVAEEIIATLGLASLADYQDYTLGLIDELGTAWVRIDFDYDGESFRVPEEYIGKLEANGIEVVGCARTTVALTAADLDAYQRQLRRLVASHPSIRTWQIDNEPNMVSPDPGSYSAFFCAGRAAVRAACPDCRIALAGAPTLDPSREETLEYYDTLLELIAAEVGPGGAPFDIFDIHYYGIAAGDAHFNEIAASYQELLARHGWDNEVRLWMSECATYSGQPSFPASLPPQSESQQADELVKRFVAALGAGVERVAWARLYENHRYASIPGNFYDFSGLVYNGLGAESGRVAAGTRKEAFYAYRLLVEQLDGYAGVSVLGPGQYRFDFRDGREPVYVVWAVSGAELSSQLSGRVTVTGLDGSSYTSGRLEPEERPVFVYRS